jgi:DNA-binding beta-propeller fold protein YncE
MAVDQAGKRLFVAELGNNSLGIVDLDLGKVVHRIAGLKEPQGVAYLAKHDMVAVASAGDGTVRFFRAGDFSAAGVLSLGDDADNIRIDPTTGNMLVGYGRGALAVIDPVKQSRLADIALPDHPESFQLAPSSGRAFVNVPGSEQIAVVDLRARKQTAHWDVAGLHANFPMAWHEPDGPLVVVFRNPAQLALFDGTSGAPLKTTPTCGDADDVFLDDKRGRIYVSCGAGAVDVFQRGADGLRQLGRVKTANGARTSLFVPALDRLFVAARASSPSAAANVLVLRPLP